MQRPRCFLGEQHLGRSTDLALILKSPPAAEPVTLEEAKAHMRIDHAHEDVLISSLILTSRLHVETGLSLALITQSWTVQMDRWPKGDAVELPLAPLQAVTDVRVTHSDGSAGSIAATGYLVDLASRPARLVWNGMTPPRPGVRANGIEIDITAGFGAGGESVPAPLRHAILLLTAHWYEHRDPIEIGSSAAHIPDAVSDLIQPFRRMRL
jgi:uncharacterized phiE125 gp8 family phage protein